MGIASGLGCRLGRTWHGLNRWERVAILVTAIAVGGLIGDHLLPESESPVTAPLRWGITAVVEARART